MAGNKDRLKANALQLQNMVNTAIGDGEPEVVEKEVVIYQDNPNAIQRHEDGTMTYKRFTMTAVGLVVPEDVQPDELKDVAVVIRDLQTSIQWIVGDLINSMEFVWGQSYQNVAIELGYEVKTVKEWAYICRNLSIRMDKLSFGHHQQVASMPSDLQAQWLQWAVENSASITALRQAMADANKNHEDRPKLRFSAVVTEGERDSFVNLTRIRNAIKGKQGLTREAVLEDAIKLKAFAEQVIRDMGGEL